MLLLRRSYVGIHVLVLASVATACKNGKDSRDGPAGGRAENEHDHRLHCSGHDI